MSQRLETFDADGGRCIGCGARLRRSADSWAWQAHHVLKAQTLRRRGVKPARLRDATFTALVCRTCHMNHETALPHLVIPFERLPARVVAAVDELGAWAHDLLRRYHPPRSPAVGEPRQHDRKGTTDG